MKVDVELEPTRAVDTEPSDGNTGERNREMQAGDRAAEVVVRVEGLSKAFRGHLGIGRKPAVRGLDLEVRRGEILGLLGPNGAGKTTTIKLLLGLLRPDCGSILLHGRPPSDPAARARVGYLPESPYFYAYLSAEEFLDFYARLQGLQARERKRIVRRTLERVGLAGRERLALRKFSKGMLQRVGLAQAIQHDPELVILDEPMSGLDPLGRRDVRDLILSLRDAGKTVLFSTHILQDVEMICDRVAILVQGRLRSSGRLEELIRHEVRSFEVSVRGVDPERLRARLISRDERHCLLEVPDVDGLSRLLSAVQEQGGEVDSVFPRGDTLEDLFLEQVRSREAGS
jgi:ABC-2 type transport system ATP-binding protein